MSFKDNFYLYQRLINNSLWFIFNKSQYIKCLNWDFWLKITFLSSNIISNRLSFISNTSKFVLYMNKGLLKIKYPDSVIFIVFLSFSINSF